MDALIEELEASVKEHGELDKNAYDLAIDTGKTNQESTVKAILDKLCENNALLSNAQKLPF